MISTRLLETPSSSGSLLRGIVSRPSSSSSDLPLVICVGGLERAASTELKFKKLTDLLNADGIETVRYDFQDCGLSDGNFMQMTVAQRVRDLSLIVDALKVGDRPFGFVAHSLGTCVVSEWLRLTGREPKAIVLLGPSFDMGNLMRLWFARESKEPFDEARFRQIYDVPERDLQKHTIGRDFFEENDQRDYAQTFPTRLLDRTLQIHGTADETVPLESVHLTGQKQLFVEGGNHDLERPDMLKVWLEPARKFLTERLRG